MPDNHKTKTKKQRRVVRTVFRILKRTLTYAMNIVLTAVIISILTGTVMGIALAIYINQYIDTDFDIENLKLDLDKTTSIYYMEFTDAERTEGIWVELEEERIHGSENRLWVSYDSIPKDLINAFVAIEDKRFFTHQGVDWKRTAGAVLEVATKGSFSYGGSTITQQLIKNVTGEDDVKIQRKLQEIFRALSLERKREKAEILEMYLNTIYLSNGCSGVKAAAKYYFGKEAAELTLAECACIAAITNAPTRYDPTQNPEQNKERRDTILEEMLEQEMITEEQFEEAVHTPIALSVTRDTEEQNSGIVHSYYVDAVIEDIIADLMEKKNMTRIIAEQMIFSGGLQIYTAMDRQVQQVMESVYEDDGNFPEAQGVKPESAMVIINPNNGNVLGLVGGRGVKTLNRAYNRATMSKRQPGSAIKPLSVYSYALEKGLITYGSVMDDTPFMLNAKTGKMWPTNSPDAYRGLTPIYDAVMRSVNTIPVKLVDLLGRENVFQFLKNEYHLSTLVEKVQFADGTTSGDIDYAPLALGGFTYGVKLNEMTAAYTTFANGGVYTTPRTYIKVLDSDGNVILSNEPISNVVISEENAQVMTKLLQGVVQSGTAARLTLKNSVDIAGKTGSTNDNKDLYFMGYTPYFVGGVWFGYDQPKYLTYYSMSPAIQIWEIVMTKLHAQYVEQAKSGGEEMKRFDLSDLVTCEYCADSGKLPGEYCELDPRGSRIKTGYFTRSTVPSEACDAHVPVRWDVVTKSVAGPDCPDDYLVTVALVRTPDRRFEKMTYVWDAQYTYMDLPDGYRYPSETDVPYYMNLYLSGLYPALTADVKRPYNSFCVEHNYGITAPWTRQWLDYFASLPTEEEAR